MIDSLRWDAAARLLADLECGEGATAPWGAARFDEARCTIGTAARHGIDAYCGVVARIRPVALQVEPE